MNDISYMCENMCVGKNECFRKKKIYFTIQGYNSDMLGIQYQHQT